MPGQRGKSGRKPLSPLGKRKQVSLTLAPEEVVFLHEKYGSPVHGLRALVRQAMAEDKAPAEEPLERIGYPQTAQALKPKVPKTAKPAGPDQWCERCQRIGTPSCDACRKSVGHQ